MPAVRLQKILSAAGIASRRAAETLMSHGRVSVNGVTVTELGTKADPQADDIRVDGRRVGAAQAHRYILLNKPPRVVTTRRDPQGRRTVMDLVAGVREAVYPVGRLDYDSEGLLLLTNDGELAAALTHPRHGVLKVYRAEVLGEVTDEALGRLSRGIVLDRERTGRAEVRRVPAAGSARRGRTLLEIGIREGRNRQVRRMCEAVGHPVARLERFAIGPIRDARLRPGQWRDLAPREVEALRSEVATATHSSPASEGRRRP